MTAKEKAEGLISKYLWPQRQFDELSKISVAKECAIILCDEMIASLAYIEDNYQVPTPTGWWGEVKKEITKL